jgi:hypothetical protein
MNLIQIQERLKELPIKDVVAYANSADPNLVPPFLALTEIERRNSAQQAAVKPPDMSVKERAEKTAMEQAATQLAADQARQQQGGQQLAQQLAQPREEVPEGIPQPSQGVRLAAGGITRLPTGNMFNFDSGGIVAFAGGDYVDNPFKDEVLKEENKTRSVQPRQQATRQQVRQAPPDYTRMAVEEAMRDIPMPRSPMDILEERKKTSPVLQKPLGADYESRLRGLEEQDIKNQQAFQERQEAQKKRDFWNALIAAGEATRSGGNVFGGFGTSYNAAQAAADERYARQEANRRQQSMDMARLNFEITNLRRAEERGDIEAMARHEQNIAEIKQKIAQNRATVLGAAETAQESKRAHLATEDINRQQIAQSAAASKAYAQTEIQKNLDLIRQLYPNLPIDQQIEKAKGLSSASMRSEGALDVAKQKEVANIRAYFEKLIGAAKDEASRQRFIAQMNEAIARATGGIGSLPTEPPKTGAGQWKVQPVNPQ